MKLIRVFLPLVIIVAGILFAKYLYDTKPVAKRVKPVIPPPLVETITLKPIDHAVIINSMGNVKPSYTISLKARVSGYVIETSPEFIQGGIYKKGDTVLKLDPNDYELVLRQHQAMLLKAEASLKLEMGKQDVARAEVKLIQNRTDKPIFDSNLALRVPQLEQIKADIASIKADIERASLNLERTNVVAPFNSMVIDIFVNKGSQISSQDIVANLSSIDQYFVESTIPTEQIKWVDFPDNFINGIEAKNGNTNNSSNKTGSNKKSKSTKRGSDVIITSADGAKYEGEVIRLLGNLSDKSLLARILIRIEDPLRLKPSFYSDTSDNESESIGSVKAKNFSNTPISSNKKNISKINSANQELLEDNFRHPLLIGSYVNADIQGRVIENVFSLPRSSVRDGDKIWLLEKVNKNNTANTKDENNSNKSEQFMLAIKNIDILWKDKESVYIKDGLKTGDVIVISELASPVNGMVVKKLHEN